MSDHDNKISDEERRQFREAVSGTRKLKQDKRAPHYRNRPAPRPQQRIKDEQQVIADMFSDPHDPTDLEIGDELFFAQPSIANKTLRKLKRGEFSVEAELDLHGYTKLEARQAISNFLAECLSTGIRCIRIIHGKGHGSHQKRAVLKQYVNHWLRQRNDILAFCSARPVDGGTGAIYVLLKNIK